MNVAGTRAAEGLPRRAFTVADIRRMVDVQVIAEDERIELFEGEIVVMAAKGYAHENIKSALNRAIVRAASEDQVVGVEMTLQFSGNVLLEPDIAVLLKNRWRESDVGFGTVEQGGCLLIIEAAVSSLSYDRVAKARLYAGFAVQEYWVIDANERMAWVHRGPSGGDWSSVIELRSHDTLTTTALPGFAIRLADID